MNFHCIDIDDSLFFLGIHVSMFDIIVGSLTALEGSCSVITCINNKIFSSFLSSSYLDLSANSQTSITDKSFTFFHSSTTKWFNYIIFTFFETFIHASVYPYRLHA